jgi:hypothetical protein
LPSQFVFLVQMHQQVLQLTGSVGDANGKPAVLVVLQLHLCVLSAVSLGSVLSVCC